MANKSPTVTETPVVKEGMKLDPKVKKRWIDALTSGKFKQAKGVLREVAVKGKEDGKPSGYCCLGVLTELFRTSKANTEKHKWDNVIDYNYDGDGNEKNTTAGSSDFDGENCLTPPSVSDWANMIDEGDSIDDPRILILPLWNVAKFKAKLKKAKIKKSGTTGDGKTSLAQLNDAGFTFKEIALIIDTYL